MNKYVTDIVTVATSIVGLAIVAVIVSKQSDAANVIKSGGSVFDKIIKAAVAPVSGSTL
jgi:hypothetical protein